jgi:hypothetical protein
LTASLDDDTYSLSATMILKNCLSLLLITFPVLHYEPQVDASFFDKQQVSQKTLPFAIDSKKSPVFKAFNPTLLSEANQNDFELIDNESLGKLKINMRARDVVSILGHPELKGRKNVWVSDGLYHQDWSYVRKGILLGMVSGKSDRDGEIFSIKITSPARLKTKRGIRIGDTYEQVRKIYQQYEDRENSIPSKTFVAGSIYGGLIFTFSNNQVTQIYLGSVAE